MSAILKIFTAENVFRSGPMTLSHAKIAANSINNEREGKLTAKIYIDGKVVYSRLDTLLADFNARLDDVFSECFQDLGVLEEALLGDIDYIKGRLEDAEMCFKLDSCAIKGDLSYKHSRYYLQSAKG